MGDTVTLDTEKAIELWESRVYANYELVDQVYQGEWRWGNNYQIVIKDRITDRLYAADVKVQSGDNFYTSWADQAQIVFVEVIRIERIEYSYRRA